MAFQEGNSHYYLIKSYHYYFNKFYCYFIVDKFVDFNYFNYFFNKAYNLTRTIYTVTYLLIQDYFPTNRTLKLTYNRSFKIFIIKEVIFAFIASDRFNKFTKSTILAGVLAFGIRLFINLDYFVD